MLGTRNKKGKYEKFGWIVLGIGLVCLDGM